MAFTTVAVAGKVVGPSGVVPTNGQISIRLSEPGSALDGTDLARINGETTVTLTAGVASFSLVPNDVIVPSGTYYRATFTVTLPNGRREAWTEKWQLTAAPTAYDLGAVPRLGVTEGAALMPVSALLSADGVAALFDLVASPVPPSDGRVWWLNTSNLPDLVAPVVTAFVLPGSYAYPSIPVTTFTATDDYGVTGYLVTESATPPLESDPGWTADPPTSVTASSTGIHSYYPWAKDAAGNVSAVATPVEVDVLDAAAPTITAFTIPATMASRHVTISSLTATDDTSVAAYIVSEDGTTPLAGDSRWVASPPASLLVAGTGSRTLYAWAKDVWDKISARSDATTNVTVNAWVDEFDDGVIDPMLWGTAVNAAGTVVETGGAAVITCSTGSAVANAAILYCKDTIDRAGTQAFEFDLIEGRPALAVGGPLFELYQRTTPPVCATNGAQGGTRIMQLRYVANQAKVDHFYRSNTDTFPTTAQFDYVRANTMRIRFETNGTQWRLLVTDIVAVSTILDTGWINWSATKNYGTGVDYMVLGDGYTDLHYTNATIPRAARVA